MCIELSIFGSRTHKTNIISSTTGDWRNTEQTITGIIGTCAEKRVISTRNLKIGICGATVFKSLFPTQSSIFVNSVLAQASGGKCVSATPHLVTHFS